ncbi:MAG: class I SAM-dependent methyltransferase [Steroidobacterales bacterium]
MGTLTVLARKSGDPFTAPIYFSTAETVIGRQWPHYIWPRIKDADFTTVVDLACGHGRNSARLAPLARRVIAVDINTECVEFVRARFANQPKVTVLQNDGSSLAGIDSGSATLVYCWDAMVHFEPEVVEAYLQEIARVLAPGGRGFIHHSNWTRGQGQDFKTQPHWRNVMSRDQFGGYLRACGLEIISQDIIDWDESKPWWKTLWGLRPSKRPFPAIDCISVFRKPGSAATH